MKALSKIFKIVTLSALCATACMAIAGCGSDVNTAETDNNFLTALCQSGELSKDDIKNIAALRAGYVALADSLTQSEEDYRRVDFTPSQPEPLDDGIKRRIEEDFVSDNAWASSCEVKDFYGQYGDYYVVEIFARPVEDVEYTTEAWPLIVEGIFMGYVGNTSYPYPWQSD